MCSARLRSPFARSFPSRSMPAMPRSIPRVLAVVLAAATVSTIASIAPETQADEPRSRVARAPVPLDGIAALVDDVRIFRSDVIARARHFEEKLSKDPTKRR